MVVSFDKPKVKNQYYVYALGSLQGVYEKQSYAIQEAEKIKGVGHFFVAGIMLWESEINAEVLMK